MDHPKMKHRYALLYVSVCRTERYYRYQRSQTQPKYFTDFRKSMSSILIPFYTRYAIVPKQNRQTLKNPMVEKWSTGRGAGGVQTLRPPARGAVY